MSAPVCRAFREGDRVLYNGMPCGVASIEERGRGDYFRVVLTLRESDNPAHLLPSIPYSEVRSIDGHGGMGVAEAGQTLHVGSHVIAPWNNGIYGATVLALSTRWVNGAPRPHATVTYKDGLSGSPTLPLDKVLLWPTAAAAAGAPTPAAPGGGGLPRLRQGDRIQGNFKSWGHWYPGRITAVNADGTFSLLYDDGDREEQVRPSHIRVQPADPSDQPWARERRAERRASAVLGSLQMIEPELEGPRAAARAEAEAIAAAMAAAAGTESAARPLAVGERVEGCYKGWGHWYKGVVTAVGEGGVSIHYADGDREENVPPSRVRRDPRAALAQATPAVGQRAAAGAEGEARAPVSAASGTESAARPLAVGERVEGCYKGWGHWYKGVVTAVGEGGLCSIHYDDGDREENVPPSRVRRDPRAALAQATPAVAKRDCVIS